MDRAEKPDNPPKIIDCSNEIVALSMADGYARVTGCPQAVLVHLDAGVMSLGPALHRARTGRVPVLVFATLPASTQEGEYRGSRYHSSHWLTDIPDQKAIVSQHCRYSAEVKRGRNIKQMVYRALSLATSEPAGPVYLQATTEVLGEAIEPYQLQEKFWGPMQLGGLTEDQLRIVTRTLSSAQEPLVVTGYSGRHPDVARLLEQLANKIPALRVLDTLGSDVCFPASHAGWLGVWTDGSHEAICTADAILILDCDVPWIPTICKPAKYAKIIHFDVDPLKHQMPLFYIDAILRIQVNSATALDQMVRRLPGVSKFVCDRLPDVFDKRWGTRQDSYWERQWELTNRAWTRPGGLVSCDYLVSQLRISCPSNTTWVLELDTKDFMRPATDQLHATLPGSLYSSGSDIFGWSGGAALGIKLALNDHGRTNFVCQIVSKSVFRCTMPTSVYPVATEHKIPVLTIVLYDKGKPGKS